MYEGYLSMHVHVVGVDRDNIFKNRIMDLENDWRKLTKPSYIVAIEIRCCISRSNFPRELDLTHNIPLIVFLACIFTAAREVIHQHFHSVTGYSDRVGIFGKTPDFICSGWRLYWQVLFFRTPSNFIFDSRGKI